MSNQGFLSRLGFFREASKLISQKGVNYWRERIYNAMMLALVITGAIALPPSVWLSISSGLGHIAFQSVVAYALVICFYFLKGINYGIRAGFFLLMSLGVGMSVFLATGKDGAGLFWMFLVPPLASLLLGFVWGSIFLGFNALFVGIIAALFLTSIVLPTALNEYSLAGWLVIGINFLATNAIVTLPFGAMLESLVASSERERKLSTDYEILFAANPLAMWVYDTVTLRFLAVNEAAVDHYGYSREEFLNMTIKEIRPPEQLGALEKNLSEAQPAKQQSGPWKHRRKDGSEILVEISSHELVFDERPARLVLANDITERMQAQEKLQQSDEILQRMQSLVLVMDKNGDMIYVSPSAEHMLGYRPEELLGQGWWTLSRIDSLDALPEKELLREIATGKRTLSSDPYVRAFLTRDGRQIWIEWQDALGPNETVIGVGRDVTERKQMESELFSLSKFPSENPNPILRFDRDARLLYSNEAAQKVFGTSEKDELVIPPQMIDVVKQVVDSGEQIKTVITYKERVFTVYCIPISGKNYINVYGWDITEKKIAEDRVIRQLDQLKVLSEIDRIILSSFDLNLNLDLLLKKAVEQLDVDAGNIMLFDRATQRLVSVRGTGFRTASFVGRSVELGEGNAGLVAQKRQPVQVDDLHGQTGNPRLARALLGEGFVSYYGVPLIAKAEVRGVLELFHRGPLPLSSEWLDLVNAFAGRAAIAIDTIQAFETLQRSKLDLTLSYEAAIEGWSRALDLRDKEPEGRSQRVATLAVELARRMGVKGEDIVNLARGALLHDLGKMSVPDDILFKKEELTEGELGIMRQHPSYARDMLEAIGYLRDAIDIPYAHHERWDGSGYPRGLKGPQIPLAARIFAVADAFDALTHDRPDGAAVSAGEALSYIQEQSGKLFDPAVVQTFLELI